MLPNLLRPFSAAVEVSEAVSDKAAEAESPATVEVAHEALIRKWDLLQQWLLQDRQMLAEIGKLEEWVRQCKEMGTLLTGSALGYAVEVGNRYPLDLPPGARSLLKLSRTRARRHRSYFIRLVVQCCDPLFLSISLCLQIRWQPSRTATHQSLPTVTNSLINDLNFR